MPIICSERTRERPFSHHIVLLPLRSQRKAMGAKHHVAHHVELQQWQCDMTHCNAAETKKIPKTSKNQSLPGMVFRKIKSRRPLKIQESASSLAEFGFKFSKGMRATKPSTRETLPRCKTSIRHVSMLALAEKSQPNQPRQWHLHLFWTINLDSMKFMKTRIWILLDSCNIVIVHAAHSMLCQAKDSLQIQTLQLLRSNNLRRAKQPRMNRPIISTAFATEKR